MTSTRCTTTRSPRRPPGCPACSGTACSRRAARQGGHRLRRGRQPAGLQGAIHEADLAGRDAAHRRHRQREAPGQRVDLECTVVNENGEAKVNGVAVAALPAETNRGRRRFDLPTPTTRRSRSGTAAANGDSSSSACADCGGRPFLPRPFCPVLEHDVAWEQASGGASSTRGRSCTKTTLPPFSERVPYVAAVVDLAEGPRMMTTVDCDRRRAAVGMACRCRLQVAQRRDRRSRSPCSATAS